MRMLLLALLLCLLLPTPAAGTPSLVALSSADRIYDVDPVTGELSNPRDLGIDSPFPLAGLAYSSTQGLFTASNASSDGRSLYRIDPVHGTATRIGPSGDDRTKGSLEFDPRTGVLYVAGLTPLSTLDVDTGEQTVVGSIGPSVSSASAMAWDPSGSLLILDGLGRRLVNVNPSDASVLQSIETWATNQDGIGRIEYATTLAGLTFHPLTGTFYVASGRSFYSIDPVSGVGRMIRGNALGVDERFHGLAYVPEPSTLLLLVAGSATLLARCPAPGSARRRLGRASP